MEMEMEEYLKNMRSLRSQMNDIEEEAAKRSVQEQKQMTAIDAMEKDLVLVKLETKRLSEEAEELVRAKEQLCWQIVGRQKKIRSLETESSTLSQTLVLLQQEKLCVAAKFEVKRNYYSKTLEHLDGKLQEQHEWFNNHKISTTQSVEDATEKGMEYTEGSSINMTFASGVKQDNMGEETSESYNDLLVQMEHAKVELHELNTKKSEVELASNKSKQLFEQFNNKLNTVPLEIKEMNMKSLEEEHKALLADIAGETEYVQSLQAQINQLKAISHVVKCPCGEEYTVNLMD